MGKKALLKAGKIRETGVWIVGKEGPPESWKDKGRLDCRWLGLEREVD